jgi:transcriptional regulator with XRE-family HTH domain
MMTRADYEFAQRVDALGAQGKSQEEIAEAVGLSTNQIRYRLFKAGLSWSREIRVRAGLTNELLAELIERGAMAVQDEPAAEAVAS